MKSKEDILKIFFEEYERLLNEINSKEVKNAAKKLRDHIGDKTDVTLRVSINRNGELEFFDDPIGFLCKAGFKDSTVNLKDDDTTVISYAAKGRILRNSMMSAIIKEIPGWGSKKCRLNIMIEDHFPEHVKSLLERLEDTLKGMTKEEKDIYLQEMTLLLEYLGAEKFGFIQVNL